MAKRERQQGHQHVEAREGAAYKPAIGNNGFGKNMPPHVTRTPVPTGSGMQGSGSGRGGNRSKRGYGNDNDADDGPDSGSESGDE